MHTYHAYIHKYLPHTHTYIHTYIHTYMTMQPTKWQTSMCVAAHMDTNTYVSYIHTCISFMYAYIIIIHT
jgi:hypothetical protein